MINRRSFIASSTAASLSLTVPSLLQARTTGPGITLPHWPCGQNSFANDTSLMFRGNPAHTFYGTGPLSDNPQLKWRFKTTAYKTRSGSYWSGTGWTGTAAKLGNYVFFGSTGGSV